jgi:hypothetical protein
MLARSVMDNLYRFVVPAVAGPNRLVPLAALADKDITEGALRVAANRGRLRAQKGQDGQWRSTRVWTDDYIATRDNPCVEESESKYPMTVVWFSVPRGNPSPKLAITVDPDVHERVLAAAAEEGISISAWMTTAARRMLLVQDGLEAVAEWEKIHGAFNEDELLAARRRIATELAPKRKKTA